MADRLGHDIGCMLNGLLITIGVLAVAVITLVVLAVTGVI